MNIPRHFLDFTLNQIPGPPLPPIDVEADCGEPEQVTVSWRPQFQGGSSQTFFVQLIVNDTWISIDDNITDHTQNDRISRVFNNLETDSQHVFRVGTVNEDKEEIFSVNSANCTVTGNTF